MSVYKGQEKVLNSITAVEEAKVKEAVKANIVTAFSDTPSDEKVPSEKLVKTELSKKVEIDDTNKSSTKTYSSNKIYGLFDKMGYKDTRDVNSPPAYYFENFPMQNVCELKDCGVLGITNANYGALQTLTCWKDTTAPIYQVLVCETGVYYRSSTISTDMASCTWRSWNKLAVTP